MRFGRWIGLVVLLGSLAASAAAALARDARVLGRLYEHLDRAEACLLVGDHAEARAWADLVLLPRPIAVRIDVSQVPETRQARALQAIDESLAMWEQVLGGAVSFVLADEADVLITFADRVQVGGHDAGGRIEFTRGVRRFGSQYRPSLRATITVCTRHPNGRIYSLDALKQIVAHEVGHLLGLEDTNRRGELMGRLDPLSPVTRPSEADLAALLLVRAEAATMVGQLDALRRP